MTIKKGQQLQLLNLISLRKNTHPSKLQGYMDKLFDYIESQGAQREGYHVSAVHQATDRNIDIEQYYPINKIIPSTSEFIFKPRIRLKNCVKTTFNGKAMFLGSAIEQLSEYVYAHSLTPISVCHAVMPDKAAMARDTDIIKVDLYISISPNIV